MMRIAGVVVAATLVAYAVLPMPAQAAGASGPAAAAANQWFGSDRALGCYTHEGQNSVCGSWIDQHMNIYYGGDGNQDALAIVVYGKDPTGNALYTAAAYFHQDGGAFRFVKSFTDLRGHGLAPKTTVRFAGGKAMLTMLTLRPGDALCCLTGRTSMTLNLR